MPREWVDFGPVRKDKAWIEKVWKTLTKFEALKYPEKAEKSQELLISLLPSVLLAYDDIYDWLEYLEWQFFYRECDESTERRRADLFEKENKRCKALLIGLKKSLGRKTLQVAEFGKRLDSVEAIHADFVKKAKQVATMFEEELRSK